MSYMADIFSDVIGYTEPIISWALSNNTLDCEQSLFCSKIRRENEPDGMRDIRAASGEAASRE